MICRNKWLTYSSASDSPAQVSREDTIVVELPINRAPAIATKGAGAPGEPVNQATVVVETEPGPGAGPSTRRDHSPEDELLGDVVDVGAQLTPASRSQALLSSPSRRLSRQPRLSLAGVEEDEALERLGISSQDQPLEAENEPDVNFAPDDDEHGYDLTPNDNNSNHELAPDNDDPNSNLASDNNEPNNDFEPSDDEDSSSSDSSIARSDTAENGNLDLAPNDDDVPSSNDSSSDESDDGRNATAARNAALDVIRRALDSTCFCGTTYSRRPSP